MTAIFTLEGRLISTVFVERNGIRLAIAETKNVEYLLKDNPPPPRGWKKNEEQGVATGPMLVLGTEIAAFVTASQAEEIGNNLIKAAEQWREANPEGNQ